MKCRKTPVLIITASLLAASSVLFSSCGVESSESKKSHDDSTETETVSTQEDLFDTIGGVKLKYAIVNDDAWQQQIEDLLCVVQKRVDDITTDGVVLIKGQNSVIIELAGIYEIGSFDDDLAQKGELIFQDESGRILVDCCDIVTAEPSVENGCYCVQMWFTEEGSEKLEQATTANVGNPVYIVFDGETVASPFITAPITDGTVVISNISTMDEAQSIARCIRSGVLPLDVKLVSEEIVLPKS